MKDPLGVSPSKGDQGTTRGKEKFLLTSVGIEPTTSGLDLPLPRHGSFDRLPVLLIGKHNGRRASLAGSTRIADLINTASVCELLYKIDPHALDPQAIVLPSSSFCRKQLML